MNSSSEYEIDAEHEVGSTPTKDEESAVLKDIDENYKHESLLVSVQLRLSYQSFFSLQRASSFLRSYARVEMYKL